MKCHTSLNGYTQGTPKRCHWWCLITWHATETFFRGIMLRENNRLIMNQLMLLESQYQDRVKGLLLEEISTPLTGSTLPKSSCCLAVRRFSPTRCCISHSSLKKCVRLWSIFSSICWLLYSELTAPVLQGKLQQNNFLRRKIIPNPEMQQVIFTQKFLSKFMEIIVYSIIKKWIRNQISKFYFSKSIVKFETS